MTRTIGVTLIFPCLTDRLVVTPIERDCAELAAWLHEDADLRHYQAGYQNLRTMFWGCR